ncbi:hypothetical protein [Leptospirillum ferriphilum]|uniref:hypothetical protein n=1 Tax=Leptospirillum ferriphilum TaxID=178606 RepID=UPI003F65B6F4
MPMGNSLLKGLSALAGIGGLVFSFFLLIWPGMTDRRIAQPVSKIQMDPIFQAVQLAQRACVLNKTDSLKVIGTLEVWAHSHSGTWTRKSFRNNDRIRMNNG